MFNEDDRKVLSLTALRYHYDKHTNVQCLPVHGY